MNRQVPIAERGINCPLHRCDVSKVCHKCAWYVHIRGKDPQSEEEYDEWKCAIAWQPIIGLEIAQQARQSGKATESFRNDMVKINAVGMAMQRRGLLK
jgi:hypothetical protein